MKEKIDRKESRVESATSREAKTLAQGRGGRKEVDEREKNNERQVEGKVFLSFFF